MSKKTVTIRDIAKQAGVSVASVSYVINGVDKVSEDTKEKVLSIIEQLGYKPNVAARELAKNEYHTIGILMPIGESYKKTILTDNPFFHEFLSGAEYAARQNNKNLTIIGINEIEDMIQNGDLNRYQAFIGLGKLENHVLQKLDKLDRPILLIDQDGKGQNSVCLHSENFEGAYIATHYLLEQNHRNILLLSGELDNIIHHERYEGYQKALADYKNVNEEVMITNVTFEGGIEAAKKIVEDRKEYDGIFCISDIVALGVIKQLTKQGVHIPEDISIIGFDNIRMSSYYNPELTTIDQNIFHKAECAIELAIQKESLQKEYRLPITLIERESVLKRK